MPTVESIASTSAAASLTFSHGCCCATDSVLLKINSSVVVNTPISKNTNLPIRHLRRKTEMFDKSLLNSSYATCHQEKLLCDQVQRPAFITLLRRIDAFQKEVKHWIRRSSNSAVLSYPFSTISIRQTALLLLLFIAKFSDTVESVHGATITTKSITPVFDENAIAAVASDSPPASKADDGAMVASDEALSSTRSARSKWRFNPKLCNIYENEPLHAIMDRVCELCHDMYSHQNSNMRVECRFVSLSEATNKTYRNILLKCLQHICISKLINFRADCFRNDSFKKCLRLFKPSRTIRSIPHLRSRRFHIWFFNHWSLSNYSVTID